jgi:hypothetical protein
VPIVATLKIEGIGNMFYVIWVPCDIPRLGIAANSEFQLYVADKGNLTIAEFVQSELGLTTEEWELV